MSDIKLNIKTIETNVDPASQVCFTVREYMGSEIFDVDDHYHEDGRLTPLTKESDVYEGRRVLTQWLTGMIMAKIKKEKDGWVLDAGGSRSGLLEFAKDERKCWVCGGWYNKEALKKIEITR
jgi:hypothetical protein